MLDAGIAFGACGLTAAKRSELRSTAARSSRAVASSLLDAGVAFGACGLTAAKRGELRRAGLSAEIWSLTFLVDQGGANQTTLEGTAESLPPADEVVHRRTPPNWA